MRSGRWMVVLAALAACGPPSLSPVPVEGTRADMSRMAGEWRGEYHSPETGRSGSIVFTLAAAGDTAAGDVVMVPRAVHGAPGPAREAAQAPGQPAGPAPLTIRFVRVEGDRVSGSMDAWRDPECGCPVSTTFTGTLAGDVVEGTFVTRGPVTHPEATGTWRVTRTPPSSE